MLRGEAVRGAMLVSVTLIGMMAQGCAGSRFVSQATSRGDTIKFAYTQNKFLETEQGIVECKVAEDGALSDCKKIEVVFEDK